jgi:hypothetical protein
MTFRSSVRIAIVCAAVAGGWYDQKVAGAADERYRPVTIAGCVVAGTKPDTFLIKDANLVMGAAPAGAEDELYLRLDSSKALKPYIGQLVHVMGIADFGDIDKGTREVVARGDGSISVKVTSERRAVTGEVGRPGKLATPAVGTGGETDVRTYKLDVQSVRMTAVSCPK